MRMPLKDLDIRLDAFAGRSLISRSGFVTFHFQIYANFSSRVLPVLFGLRQNSNCRYWATGYSSFRESRIWTMAISLERNAVFQKSFDAQDRTTIRPASTAIPFWMI
jgi:hypothetical protein